jgi:8-oxo-dGTP pyrophosphatase MutT (NUDIX family)
MTFPADGSDRLFNLVVRGLAFERGHLLVSQWVGGYCFPIGGRLNHGEGLEEAVLREFAEETGVTARLRRLVYFHENFFVDSACHQVHDLGWYYWIDCPSPPIALGEVRLHPDHPDLRLTYIALDQLDRVDLRPDFLSQHLPADHAQGFPGPVRHFISHEFFGSPATTTEAVPGWFGPQGG